MGNGRRWSRDVIPVWAVSPWLVTADDGRSGAVGHTGQMGRHQMSTTLMWSAAEPIEK